MILVKAQEHEHGPLIYRVYRTHSGCRVICTRIAVPREDHGWMAERVMQFLRADPDYIKLCRHQKYYRARLTPKPWRDKGDSCRVCEHFSTEGKKPHELTLPDHEWAELA